MNGKLSYFREMYGSDRNIKETNRRKNDTDSETRGYFVFSGVGHLQRNDSTLTAEKFHSFLWRRATICGWHLLWRRIHSAARWMNPNKLDRTPWRPKKTKKSNRSWTFLHSHLTSTPLNIIGATWRQAKHSVTSLESSWTTVKYCFDSWSPC